MEKFFPKFALKQYSTHVAVIVIFVYNYVLDQDLKCTCENEDQLFCNLYLALPFLILFTLQLWTDETFKRIWKYTCSCCSSCKFFFVLACHIVKAACVGLLWVISLLIEGDWYVCCHNTYKDHPHLGCKVKQNTTDKERVLIAKLKNTSMLIGLGILLTGFLVVTFVLSCGWQKCSECCGKKCSECCGKKCSECCGKKCSSVCDRKHLYDQMILEEEDSVLKEMMRKAAREKLTEKIQQKFGTERWWECFDVAEDLIKEKTPPGKKEEIVLEDRKAEREKLMTKAEISTTL